VHRRAAGFPADDIGVDDVDVPVLDRIKFLHPGLVHEVVIDDIVPPSLIPVPELTKMYIRIRGDELFKADDTQPSTEPNALVPRPS
jgi:hypothetical protein